MVARLLPFRLVDRHEQNGLSCESEGLSLAGVPLLRKAATGLVVRSQAELAALMLAAYGDIGEPVTLERRLEVVAAALDKGDVGLAMVAALHLRLPTVSAAGAARLAAVEDVLAKYNSQEPRDWHGRWTTGLGGDPPPDDGSVAAPGGDWRSRPLSPLATPSAHQVDADADADEPRPWEGPSEREPWEEPERAPELADGRPWPRADPDAVRRILSKVHGQARPSMWVYVPTDGNGPLLIGSDGKEEYYLPKGYAKVQFIGTPQETTRDGTRTNHALDGINFALQEAGTNRYGRFYFNTSVTTSTNGEVVSRLRPDVMAVLRPDTSSLTRYLPYESFSPRQDQEARRLQLDLHPRVAPLQGQAYKFLQRMWTRFLRRLLRP